MNTAKPITIYDIAREADVSPSTVSRVLNGNTPVAPSKQAAVQAAIERLNFRPNVAAQGLARGKTTIVGVLTQDIASPFYGEILRGIEEGLSSSGYSMICASGNWQLAEEIKSIRLLVDRRVDGLIVLGGQLPDSDIMSMAQNVSLIVVGRSVKGLEDRCLCVDNFSGAYRATRYLIELGHRRIVNIQGILSHADAVERFQGYCQALQDAGIPLDEDLIIEGNFLEQSGLLAIETLLQRGRTFSAIFAANDQMAYGVRLALFRRGIRVPEDVSVVGFDDLPGSAFTTPPLTTVRQPTQEMGLAAATAMLTLIEKQKPQTRSFEPRLIIRESAAPKPR